jgi:hypothetical protein
MMVGIASTITWPDVIGRALDLLTFGGVIEETTFQAACRKADQAVRRPQIIRARPTPGVTIEAIKVAVRARGVAALDEPATRERLSRCDKQAIADIDLWLSKYGITE